MDFVEALSYIYKNRGAMKLPEWEGYWHFNEKGDFVGADNTPVENERIAMYSLRHDFEYYIPLMP